MNKRELPMTEYNDILFNCLINNQLGFLRAQHPDFYTQDCFVTGHYEWQENSLNDPQGPLVFYVDYDILDFESYVTPITFPLIGIPQLDQVKAWLREGYYLFVPLDRFYFTGGVEFQDTHLVHASFVYGYDDDEQSFLLMEDCVQHGQYVRYKLSYSDFKASCAALKDTERKPIRGFSPKAQKPPLSSDYYRNMALANLERLLRDERRVLPGGSVRYTGLVSVKKLAENLETVDFLIPDFVTLRRVSTQAIGLKKRDLKLVELLTKEHLIGLEAGARFRGSFSCLLEKWTLFQKGMFLNFYRKKNKLKRNMSFFDEMKTLLREIHDKEGETQSLLLAELGGPVAGNFQ